MITVPLSTYICHKSEDLLMSDQVNIELDNGEAKQLNTKSSVQEESGDDGPVICSDILDNTRSCEDS